MPGKTETVTGADETTVNSDGQRVPRSSRPDAATREGSPPGARTGHSLIRRRVVLPVVRNHVDVERPRTNE